MMMRWIWIGMVAWLGWSCQSGAPQGPRVEEITDPSLIDNADIIRNPVSASGRVDSSQLAKMTFKEVRFNFGAVKAGEVVEHEFTFVNTGKVPLIINHAESTCGCTVPEWPKRPIAPGEQGAIKVKFDTANKEAEQLKPVTIYANTLPTENKVYLEGFVGTSPTRFLAPAAQ